MLLFGFTASNAITLLVMLAMLFSIWYLATKVALPAPPAQVKHFVSLEYDIDAVPFKPGSTLTVFGVTFVVVNHAPAAPNQVQASANYHEQWENFYSALVSAEISPGEPFTHYYSLAYGFYITITDTGNRNLPPAPSGFFGGAVSVYEISKK